MISHKIPDIFDHLKNKYSQLIDQELLGLEYELNQQQMILIHQLKPYSTKHKISKTLASFQ